MPELSIGRYDLNHIVAHFATIEPMAQTIETGGNPIDVWVPRTYHLLPCGLVVGLYFALAKSAPLLTVFRWTKYLVIVGIPLSFFAAVCSPLLATNGL